MLTAAGEHMTEVEINGVPSMRLICTPEHLPELIVGRLLSEGMADDVSQIRLIHVCETGARVSVVLEKTPKEEDSPVPDTAASCCTGNQIISDRFRSDLPDGQIASVTWDPVWLTNALTEMETRTPLFDLTRSVHSCGLIYAGKLLYCFEDIGRHNAVDKAIGAAARDGLDLNKCLLLSTGRIATDMAEKAIRVRIPVFGTTKFATDKAVQLAKKYALTLAVYVREDRVTILN